MRPTFNPHRIHLHALSAAILAGLFLALQGAYAGTIPNPLGDDTSSTSIPSIVARVIKGLLGITGAAALVMFIYGGAVWMTAMGEDKKVKQGWDTMVWAAMGMAVIFGSYAVVRYVVTALLGSAPT